MLRDPFFWIGVVFVGLAIFAVALCKLAAQGDADAKRTVELQSLRDES